MNGDDRLVRRVSRRPQAEPFDPLAWPYALAPALQVLEHGWDVPPGVTFLVGENGSGKSTLLAVLAGRVAPDGGSLALSGRLRRGLLSQEPVTRVEGVSVRDAYRTAVGTETAERVPIATLGLLAGRDLDRPVGALSVGQRRRLDLAVLIADPPEVILLDEPTTGLDVTTEAQILDLIAELKRSFSSAILYISHNLGVIARISDRIGVMYRGKIAGEVPGGASAEEIGLLMAGSHE